MLRKHVPTQKGRLGPLQKVDYIKLDRTSALSVFEWRGRYRAGFAMNIVVSILWHIALLAGLPRSAATHPTPCPSSPLPLVFPRIPPARSPRLFVPLTRSAGRLLAGLQTGVRNQALCRQRLRPGHPRVRPLVHPNPYTLHPKPSTLNPEPWPLNPKP